MARILDLARKNDDAWLRLRDVTSQFEARGLVTDAALASVDPADALLALGQMRQIVDLATHVFAVFMDAGMLTSGLTALAYMKEAAAAGQADGCRTGHGSYLPATVGASALAAFCGAKPSEAEAPRAGKNSPMSL